MNYNVYLTKRNGIKQQFQFWNQAQGRDERENASLPNNGISRPSHPDFGRIRGETARNNDVLLAKVIPRRPAPATHCLKLELPGIKDGRVQT
ncbi:MAG TPA: hypothetical protein EYP41_20285 [Anaerolineae bacterium]|nr:hypothetical protein [Anaerolineae bacterium]HIP71025.1 hypothetical protein [Anaerolineae bacterium]